MVALVGLIGLTGCSGAASTRDQVAAVARSAAYRARIHGVAKERCGALATDALARLLGVRTSPGGAAAAYARAWPASVCAVARTGFLLGLVAYRETGRR